MTWLFSTCENAKDKTHSSALELGVRSMQDIKSVSDWKYTGGDGSQINSLDPVQSFSEQLDWFLYISFNKLNEYRADIRIRMFSISELVWKEMISLWAKS